MNGICSSICAALDASELGALEALAEHARFAEKQTVTPQGDAADSVYNVTEGTVRLCKLLPDGRRQIVGFLLPGDFLGPALSDRYAFSADAVEPVKAGCTRRQRTNSRSPRITWCCLAAARRRRRWPPSSLACVTGDGGSGQRGHDSAADDAGRYCGLPRAHDRDGEPDHFQARARGQSSSSLAACACSTLPG